MSYTSLSDSLAFLRSIHGDCHHHRDQISVSPTTAMTLMYSIRQIGVADVAAQESVIFCFPGDTGRPLITKIGRALHIRFCVSLVSCTGVVADHCECQSVSQRIDKGLFVNSLTTYSLSLIYILAH
jgi:hypothetical protein